MHFTGYIKNQLNGSNFKHKRMHILEFGQMAIHASSAHTYTNTHTPSLPLSLSLLYFCLPPSSLPNLGVPHDRPLSHLLLPTLGSLT